MKVIIEKVNGLVTASCEFVNGGKKQRQHLREDHVYVRVCDNAIMIGDHGGSLRPAATEQEIAMAHAFQSVKALVPFKGA